MYGMFRLNFNIRYNFEYCYISTVLEKTKVFLESEKPKSLLRLSI